MKILLSALIIGFFLLGCAPVMVNAPTQETKLLSEGDFAPGKTTLRCWYLLWGLIPISDNSTAQIIGSKGYKGVRAKVVHGVVDIIVDVLFGGLIYTDSRDRGHYREIIEIAGAKQITGGSHLLQAEISRSLL